MTNQVVYDIVKSRLIPVDKYIYGFANLIGLLHEKFREYPCGISIGRKLDDTIMDGITDAPNPEYLRHYEDVNRQTQAVAESIACELNNTGIGAMVIKPTVLTGQNELDRYLPALRYDISHKMVATRAGLGWIGKTDLFISVKFGARLRLISILVKKEITPAYKTIDKSRCGKCMVCVEKCPAGAATGRLWDIYTDRDVFFDALKCREKCVEFGRTHLKVDRKLCGICVAVCPVGRNKKIQGPL